MTVAQFVSELEMLGVTLWEESGELRFRAPRGIVSGERLELLRNQKDVILDYVRRDRLPDVIAQPSERHDPFPLTEIQAAYLLGRGTAYAHGGVACHAYGELEFDTLDVDRLQRAWNRLIERHDMLRSVVSSDGTQRVLAEVPPYIIPTQDVRRGTPAQFADTVHAARHEMDHRIHPIGIWPMFELRATLGHGRAVLHISIDFLIADYVSIQVLLAELRLLYADPDQALPPIGTTFRDYYAAERRLRDGPAYQRARSFWWSRIDDLPGSPELPLMVPSPAGGAAKFRRWKTELDTQQWSQLRRAASTLNITPSVAILTAYAEVIRCWSRNPRFLLDVTLLQRLPLHSDVHKIVGDFTSVLPLVVDDEHDSSLAARASRIQSALLEGMDHRLCSGIEVMREIARRRGPEAALLPVVFTSAVGAVSAETGAPAAFGRLGYGISQTPQVWIDCQVMEREGALHVNWDVRENVFPADVVEDMFTVFAGVLTKMAADAEIWTRSSPCSPPESQLRRRALVNSTAAPLPSELLQDAFIEQAAAEPARPAIFCESTMVSYGELLERSQSVASALVRAGCAKGDLVAIMLERSPEQIAAVMGTLIAGAAYVPVDVSQPAARTSSILRNAACKYVITHSALASSVGDVPDITCLAIDDLAARPGTPIVPRSADADALAYVIYTSGSTGVPKGVMITHRSALNTVLDICRRFNIRASDRAIALSHLSFDLSVFDIFGLLRCGAAIVIPNADRQADPSHWAQLVRKHAVTIWNSVPARLEMLHGLPSAERAEPLASLRVVLLSGDWIATSLPARVRSLVPNAELVSLGGATEAAIWSILFPIREAAPDWRSIPYGKPLANQRFHVLDRGLQHRPDWVAGELYIGGAGLAAGYLADPAKTAERFIIHPRTAERLYRTGDFGRYLPDGNIEFLGREDSQVKIRGHRIELAELDATLNSHPAIAESATIVYGTAPLDRRLAAFAVPASVMADALGLQAQAQAVQRAAAAASAEVLRCIDVEAYLGQMRKLDRIALDSMLLALTAIGLFSDQSNAADVNAQLARLGVLPKHWRLVRRWIAKLTAHGLVSMSGAGSVQPTRSVDPDELERAWQQLAEQPSEAQPAEVLAYFRSSAAELPRVLRGATDPLQLLFPGGATGLSRDLYEHALFNRWANCIAASAASVIAHAVETSRPLRVLELGAGQGGTTQCILEALADTAFEYVISDISPFFLNECRVRFANRSGLKYQTFDINQDFHRQGLVANSFDLIVAGDVLHNAEDITSTLASIRALLGARGWLLLLEMTRDHGQIMTSLELLNGLADGQDFSDLRRGRDQLFLEADQWRALLSAQQASEIVSVDQSAPALAEIGMRVFATCFKADRQRTDAATLLDLIRSRLPGYMLPAYLEVIDELPLTRNAKVDRKTLESWLPGQPGSALAERTSSEYRSDLERRIASVWAAVLAREDIPPDANFFSLGGDSLLAAQLATRLIEEIPEAAGRFFDDILRSILGEPTIAQLAATLEAASIAAALTPEPATQSPLLVLRSSAPTAPRVFVHDADGTLAGYGDLLQAADSSEYICGLVVSDPQSYLQIEPERLIETVASRYVRVLQNANLPPVDLIGCRFGGLLAAEIARQLSESGIEVRSLTTIASLPSMLPAEDTLLAEYVFAVGLGIDPTELGFPARAVTERAFSALRDGAKEHSTVLFGRAEDRACVADAIDRLEALSQRSQDERFRSIASALPTLAAGDTIEQRYRVFLHSLRAAGAHGPSLFAGDVTVVQPAQSSPLCPTSAAELIKFWSAMSLGELRTLEIPCGPFDCLQGDCLRLVSRLLQAG